MVNVRKKMISLVVTCIICTLMLASIVFAYDSQSVGFNFDGNSSATGGVDGSSNSRYYSLSNGNVTLKLTNKISNISGTNYAIPSSGLNCTVILYREKSGTDQSYGMNTILYTSSGNSTTSRWTVDTDSSKYYLYVTGGSSYHYDSQGTFYDKYEQ